MLPYYILIFFPMLVSLLQNRRMIRIGGDTRADVPKGPLTAFFLILIGILMCRGMANGADLDSYLYYFETIGGFSWKQMWQYDSLERGYILFVWLITRFTDNYQVFLAIVAVLSVWPVYRFYRKEAESPLLTMILFATIAPFSMYYSGLRQILAMTFAFPLWNCAREKKWFRFLVLLWLATLFHRSAFVMLAIYPLYHAKITPKWLFVVMPMIAVIYVFKVPIFNLLVQLFWDGESSAAETGATTVLILLVLLAVYAFVIPDEGKMDADMMAYRNILLLTIVIQCFAPIHSLAMRMNYYFLLFVPLLIPKIAGRSAKRYYSIANLSVAVLTLFFTFYFFRNAYTGADILQVFPYVPFWSE